ncbi:MAG TPA: hypothetical protein VK981_17255 [Ramlibacter sp.]|nr:hypothetical protein [Ramlibacter sp.]
MPDRPIFIHAWWRSSSTYVWSKLRSDTSLMCFNEPLHERIARLDADKALKPMRASYSKMLRHPYVEKGYFTEYFELDPQGPRLYKAELAYHRYLLRPDERAPGLHAYLSSLLAMTEGANRRAVLCFTRSQMRSAWMRDAFDALHIAQIRNPRSQWKSFHIDSYFLQRLALAALRLHSRQPAAFQHIAPFRNRPAGTADTAQFTLSDRDLCRVFLLFWIASTIQSITASDFVLDVDRLAAEPDYRTQASSMFADAGCTLDFDDCETPKPDDEGADARVAFGALVDEAVAALKSHASALIVQGPFPLHERAELLSRPSAAIVGQYLHGLAPSAKAGAQALNLP